MILEEGGPVVLGPRIRIGRNVKVEGLWFGWLGRGCFGLVTGKPGELG